MNIQENFVKLTGFTPRKFQEKTITNILKRENVILRAPTGSGKTETAIAPFLFAKLTRSDFPSKLIYVVPLRTLANSLRQRTQTLIKTWSNFYPPDRPLTVTLQTGENPEDPRFEGDIVFCTIDQMLSSFLNIPYGLGRGSGNVNAGVFFASYLVFDEIHLLDFDRSFASLIKVLQLLGNISPFLLMTATLTHKLAISIQQEINSYSQVHLESVNHNDLSKIEGARYRTFETASTALTPDCIINDIHQYQRQRVIVICNRVSLSQALFKGLQNLIDEESIELTLLHSRFLPEDRAIKEARLTQVFSQHWGGDGKTHILIATQVIEAGLNLTCEVMHLQLSPMNSLLQRAGRCARFPGERGRVIIYPDVRVGEAKTAIANTQINICHPNHNTCHPEGTEGTPKGARSEGSQEIIQSNNCHPEGTEGSQQKTSYLPYEEKICLETWQLLLSHTQSAQTKNPVTYSLETNWIDEIHGKEEAIAIERRKNQRGEFERLFNNALFMGDYSTATDLIRRVDSRSIFVWENNLLIDFEEETEINPQNLQAFSVPITTLSAIWREAQQQGYVTDWLFKKIIQPRNQETYAQPICEKITTHTDLVNSIRILVNPRYLYYDRSIGLLMGVNHQGNYFTSPKLQPKVSSEFSYRMDTYVGHLGCMWQSWLTNITYPSVKTELLSPGGRFIKNKIFPNSSLTEAEALFEYLVFFAIFTHDLGKLQLKWQQVMRGWQAIAHQQFSGKNPSKHLIAHTDYNPTDPEQVKQLKAYEKQNPRPNHAIESAFLAREILIQSLLPLLQNQFSATPDQIRSILHTIIMAGGRHHSAWAKGWDIKQSNKIKAIELHPQAREAIAQTWLCLSRFLPQGFVIPPPNLSRSVYPTQEFQLDRFTPSDLHYLQLYALVVRGLRLCDMRSVQ